MAGDATHGPRRRRAAFEANQSGAHGRQFGARSCAVSDRFSGAVIGAAAARCPFQSDGAADRHAALRCSCACPCGLPDGERPVRRPLFLSVPLAQWPFRCHGKRGRRVDVVRVGSRVCPWMRIGVHRQAQPTGCWRLGRDGDTGNGTDRAGRLERPDSVRMDDDGHPVAVTVAVLCALRALVSFRATVTLRCAAPHRTALRCQPQPQ